MARQATFTYRTWGGARKGAGRKPNGAKAAASHLRRPRIDARLPLHLTMKESALADSPDLPELERSASPGQS